MAERPAALRFWRSPPDQPRWARPALLAVAALAALSYTWGIAHVGLEPFYGAAARSMSVSWHNFFFGSFDPWGTVSVDKLPGSLWLQALSLGVFGFHVWAIALPQVIEGTLTVLVLYRAVRRVGGSGAGLVAAIVLAASPATVLLNRGNISDSLLILLLVLAADATSRAIVEGRARSLALAGLWVGLAFQAKMTQAWIVLPALFAAYLIAASGGSVARRCRDVALSAVVALVVSLSWMTAVSAVPANDRPYVDGSCNNSLFSQVFEYNGIDRLGAHSLDAAGCNPPSLYLVQRSQAAAVADINTGDIHGSWDRLLQGVFGRDDGWFLVPSVVAALGLMVARRRRPRSDAIRAAVILWSVWLVVTFGFFSGGTFLNSYYVAALIPAMAALCGLGLSTAWRRRAESLAARVVLMVAVIGSTAYSVVLLPSDAGVRPWVIGSTTAVSVLALVALFPSIWRRHNNPWTTTVGVATAGLALLLGSSWAAGTVVVAGQGPFNSPYQSAELNALYQAQADEPSVLWPVLRRFASLFPTSQAVDTIETSYAAGNDILATGREFLSVGGFTGRVPAPSLSHFVDDVAARRVVRALVATQPLTRSPDLLWVVAHCSRDTSPTASFTQAGTTFRRYLCSPGDVVAARAP